MAEQGQGGTRGAQYDIGANDPGHALGLLRTEEKLSSLPKGQLKLVEAIIRTCAASTSGVAGINAVAADTGLSVNTIAAYSDKLVAKGYLRKYKIRNTRQGGKGRQPNIYSLVDLSLAVGAELDDDLITPGMLPADGEDLQRSLFDAADLPAADTHRALAVLPGVPQRAEIFSTYTLLSVLRLGNSGSRARGSFTTPAYIGPNTLRIHVAAVDGQKIAGIMDTKALIGLTTLARSFYSDARNAGEPLVLEMSDFANYLGYKDDGGNRAQVWDMVNSWRQTNFKILSASEGLVKLYGRELFEIDDFSFISRLKTLVEGGTGTPIKFAVWFDPLFLKRVLHPEYKYLSVVHPQILREKNPSRLLFYFWCRRAVQYTTESTRPYSFEKLRMEMAPYMTQSAFRNTLLKILDQSGEGGVTEIYSYRVLVHGSLEEKSYTETEFSIWIDVADPFVHQYRRHQQLEQGTEA